MMAIFIVFFIVNKSSIIFCFKTSLRSLSNGICVSAEAIFWFLVLINRLFSYARDDGINYIYNMC